MYFLAYRLVELYFIDLNSYTNIWFIFSFAHLKNHLSTQCRLMPTPSAPAAPALMPLTPPTQLKERGNCSKNTQNSEVETELFIGLPVMRCS